MSSLAPFAINQSLKYETNADYGFAFPQANVSNSNYLMSNFNPTLIAILLH